AVAYRSAVLVTAARTIDRNGVVLRDLSLLPHPGGRALGRFGFSVRRVHRTVRGRGRSVGGPAPHGRRQEAEGGGGHHGTDTGENSAAPDQRRTLARSFRYSEYWVRTSSREASRASSTSGGSVRRSISEDS